MIDARKSEAATAVPPVPVAPSTPIEPVEPAVPAAPKAPEVVAVPQSTPAPAPVERVAKEVTKEVVKEVAKADEGVKAKALLEGRAPESQAQADNGRYVVQVGAFADPKRAHEVRLKVERSGLKTYTQVAETKDGSRIRVRVGPFDSKGEADKAAEKIKRLDLPVAILTL
jgi:DedD protein